MSSQLKNLSIILTALEFASRKHRDQRRKDASSSPYINHPISLANVLCNEASITDPKVICAALLHDTIEDTETTEQELKDVFGKAIAKIVVEVKTAGTWTLEAALLKGCSQLLTNPNTAINGKPMLVCDLGNFLALMQKLDDKNVDKLTTEISKLEALGGGLYLEGDLNSLAVKRTRDLIDEIRKYPQHKPPLNYFDKCSCTN